jgi:hypothetical protein
MNSRELFEVVLDVDASGLVHPHYSVAAVFAVVQAPDETSAFTLLEQDLAQSGYTVLRSQRRATRIPAEERPRYIRANWPILADQLPTLDDLLSRLCTSTVVHLSFYPHD